MGVIGNKTMDEPPVRYDATTTAPSSRHSPIPTSSWLGRDKRGHVDKGPCQERSNRSDTTLHTNILLCRENYCVGRMWAMNSAHWRWLRMGVKEHSSQFPIKDPDSCSLIFRQLKKLPLRNTVTKRKEIFGSHRHSKIFREAEIWGRIECHSTDDRSLAKPRSRKSPETMWRVWLVRSGKKTQGTGFRKDKISKVKDSMKGFKTETQDELGRGGWREGHYTPWKSQDSRYLVSREQNLRPRAIWDGLSQTLDRNFCETL